MSTLGERFRFQMQGLEKDGWTFHSPKHQKCLYYSPRSPETKITHESRANDACNKYAVKEGESWKDANTKGKRKE